MAVETIYWRSGREVAGMKCMTEKKQVSSRFEKSGNNPAIKRTGTLQSVFPCLLLILIICSCLPGICAGSPEILFARLDLNHTQTFKQMSVSSVESIDVMNFSQSEVQLLSTTGDGSDIKHLVSPNIRNLRRVFSSQTAEWSGNTLTILGPLDSVTDWSGWNGFDIYKTLNVPTVHSEVPGATGDILIFKVNESADRSSLEALFESSDIIYFITGRGIIAIIPSTNTYITSGVINSSDFDKNNLTYTLAHNTVDLSSFTENRNYALDLSNPASGAQPVPGEYMMAEFSYDQADEKIITYSLWPVVILNGDNHLELAGMSPPYQYNKKDAHDLTLTFEQVSGIDSVAYLLVKKPETYDIRIDVDMENMSGSLNDPVNAGLVSGNPLLSGLTSLISPSGNNNLFAFSILRVGSVPVDPVQGSIVITPGFGFSGFSNNSASAVVPSGSLAGLTNGDYYIYALGTTSDGEIKGFDQSEILIYESPVAAFSGEPLQGPSPLTVQFTDLSTGSPTYWSWNFGDGSVNATLQNPGHVYSSSGTYTVTLTSGNEYGCSTTQKTGYITVTGVPPIPHAFYGNVTILGETAPAYSIVSGVVTGGGGSIQTDIPGHYGYPGALSPKLLIQGGITQGSPITFYVNGFMARCRDVTAGTGWQDSYPFSSGTITVLDLNVAEIPLAADFVGSPRSGTAPLSVQFIDNSTGYPTSWNWNFGDGTENSTQQSPAHVYQSPGTYDVILTISNAYGQSTVHKAGYITVSTPGLQADFTGYPQAGFVPLTVQFMDTSTGAHNQWTWSFGDGGTSNAANPSHIYQTTGTFTVSLTIRDGQGGESTATKPNYITVTGLPPAPVANFTANITEGMAPLHLQFTDLSSGSPYEWAWNFGDGATSTLQNPEHIFRNPGNYTVSLTVRNIGGSDTETKINYIHVQMSPPVADFSGEPRTGFAPLSVAFTDLSTGGPDVWSWTFGDGSGSAERDPVHVYMIPGTYTVNLTVSNARGSDTLSKSGYIEVGESPLPVANFTANPSQGYEPLMVQFTDTSLGNPVSWYWEFGDGKTAVDQNPPHLYYNGDYTVTLTVTNAEGNSTVIKPAFIRVYRRGGGGGGGGGGSGTFYTGNTTTPTPTLTPTPVPTPSGTIPLDANNTTTQTVVIVSPDGVVSVIIGPGVQPVDGNGQPLTELLVTPAGDGSLPQMPGAPYVFTGFAYLIQPLSASFDPCVTLLMSFTEEQWNTFETTDLTIMMFNSGTGTWETLPTTVDPAARTVRATICTGGTYGLFEIISPPVTVTATQIPQTTPVTAPFPWMLVIPVIIIIAGAVAAAIYLIGRRTRPPKKEEELFENDLK
jgi:PKD repeat protein